MRQPDRVKRGARKTTIIFLVTIVLSISLSIGGNPSQIVQAQESSEDLDGVSNSTLQISNSTIRGDYDYLETVSVTFPDGWTGFEVSNYDASLITVAVGKDALEDLDDLNTTDPLIFLAIYKKSAISVAPGLSPPVFPTFNNGTELDCELKSLGILLTNRIFSHELASECSIPTTAPEKGEGNETVDNSTASLHSVLTHTNDLWVALMFFGRADAVENDLPEFDKAKDTLAVVAAENLDIPFGSPSINSHSFMVNGSMVPIDVVTSSGIADLELNQEEMTINFKAEGLPRIGGITEISVGRVLEGPYIVTVNGDIWSDFKVIDEDDPRESRVQVRYDLGSNNIVIKGTQVVPEFSNGMISIAMIGTVLIATASIIMLKNRLIR